MTQIRTLMFSCALIAGLNGMVATSYAHGPYFESAAQEREWRLYQQYEEREPCQNYRTPPLGWVRVGCDLHRMNPSAGNRTTVYDSEVLSSYDVNFAFDRATIEPDAVLVLDRIAREIRAYQPSEVTVAGYADRAGAAAYNMALSKRRADAVSKALSERGVPNRITNEYAFGENDPVIETRDGVPLRENRRVRIEFRK